MSDLADYGVISAGTPAGKKFNILDNLEKKKLDKDFSMVDDVTPDNVGLGAQIAKAEAANEKEFQDVRKNQVAPSEEVATTANAPLVSSGGRGTINPPMVNPEPAPAPVVAGRSTVYGDQKQAPVESKGPPVPGMGDFRKVDKPVSKIDQIMAELSKEDERGIMDILQAAFAGYAGKESDWSKRQGEKRQQKTDLQKTMAEAELNQAAQMESLAKQYELMGRADEAAAIRQAARDVVQQKYELERIQEQGKVQEKNKGSLLELAEKMVKG